MTRQVKWGLLPQQVECLVLTLLLSLDWQPQLPMRRVWNPHFAVAAMFSIIVMYDASGVRYQAGQHATILNQLRKDFQTLLHDLKMATDGRTRKNGGIKNIIRP